MKYPGKLAGLAVFGSFCSLGFAGEGSAGGPPEPPKPDRAWKLVWSDEFDRDGLPDPARWAYDVGGHGWGNRERQYYTESRPENARVEDGRLIIEARREAWEGCDYTSARLVTRGRAAWTYGRFEIRAKLPAGRGSWPAIWMLPVEWTLGTGKWPDVGEIDIMEHVGHEPGVIHASAHSRDHQWQNGTQKTATVVVPDATTAFHTYVLEWEPDVLRAYVDDRLYFVCPNEGRGWRSWPYDRDFYLLLNIAVGGVWGGVEGIDDASLPWRMEVDYVRVYQRDAGEGKGGQE